MLPILRVLIDNQTIQSYVDQQIVASHQDLDHLPWYLNAARGAAAHLPTHPVKAVAAVFGIILALSLVGSAVRFFQEYLSVKASISAVTDIRRHLYDHILHTPLSFFGTQGTSDVTS